MDQRRSVVPRLPNPSLIYRNGSAEVKVLAARRPVNALLGLIRVWRTKHEKEG
jgi:hypothetical protein